MARILCLSDDAAVRDALVEMLFALGHEPSAAASISQARTAIRRDAADLILSDHVERDARTAELIELTRSEGHDLSLIFLSGQGEIDAAVRARKAGAAGHVTKPVRAAELEVTIADALEGARLRRENETLRRAASARELQRTIVGESPATRALLRSIATAALTQAPVLLQGEPGSGRAFAARAIHAQGARRDGAFVAVDGEALTPDDLASARGGTLLLREISAVGADMRGRIASMLDRGPSTRVGADAPVAADFRLIATTTRDLGESLSHKRTHDDLFTRLFVLPIRVPPLRERREDIPLLAGEIANAMATALGKTVSGIDPAALALLQSHDWPGNVAELRQAVTEAVISATEPLLQPFHFSAERFGTVNAGEAIGFQLPSLSVVEAERLLIQEALRRTDGNRTHAAALLQMSVRTLRYKLSAHSAPNGPG